MNAVANEAAERTGGGRDIGGEKTAAPSVRGRRRGHCSAALSARPVAQNKQKAPAKKQADRSDPDPAIGGAEERWGAGMPGGPRARGCQPFPTGSRVYLSDPEEPGAHRG
ncbi:hypothetical protein NDU88_006303 [Pleurodeles waltl]|uniref:Uncharacterized protein n=1 Tax=Pleurodeles waltl TaxID=8319 RepID=A0AAV7PQZ4_PLEWA|nr:hypothetical protein NDU88_006303 [Pleurodeles waltl]